MRTIQLHTPLDCDPVADRDEAQFMNARALEAGELLDPAELRVDWEETQSQQASDEAEYYESVMRRYKAVDGLLDADRYKSPEEIFAEEGAFDHE